jgi:hypothetical protein
MHVERSQLVIRYDNLPFLEKPLWNVTAIAVLLAPRPQLVRVRAGHTLEVITTPGNKVARDFFSV